MQYQCSNCSAINDVPKGKEPSTFMCHNCGKQLSGLPHTDGSTSAAVGLVGGAALGAAIGGPVGAIIGGILGGILGKESKGVG
jgi:DNA-directed RNA polymerase subunit RPC12/RpoP